MMFFACPKNHEMRRSILLGSAALLFLLGLSHMLSLLMKYPERPIAFERKEEGSVAVELVVNKQERGVYYVSGDYTVAKFLSRVDPDFDVGINTVIADGMTIRIMQDHAILIDEMAPHKKLALNIPLDINHLSQVELMLVPGIGEKTAAAIHSYIKNKGFVRDLSELSDISGIKERKIAAMRKYFITKPNMCARSTPRT
jgi:hypothetical protein